MFCTVVGHLVLTHTVLVKGLDPKLFPPTVPSRPANVKAVSSDQHSVLVSWLPPAHRNGELSLYTVYMKTMEGGRQFTQHFEVYPPETSFLVRGLKTGC